MVCNAFWTVSVWKALCYVLLVQPASGLQCNIKLVTLCIVEVVCNVFWAVSMWNVVWYVLLLHRACGLHCILGGIIVVYFACACNVQVVCNAF